ncbi:S-adenosyl-L-methionine-dependent methyltransferase, partial [Clavulina sp. PMI_390]
MSSGNVHNVAQVGFGTGTNELYDKARPSYPSDALAALHAAIPKTDGKLNVLELGSGTGIFTRALLADPTFGPAVGKLEAVEPSAGMRATLEDKTKDERVVSREGTFSESGVPDGWADLVVVAQAFHWCPDYSAAMIEIARALKPNGVAAFIWNMEDQDAAGWVQDLRTFYEDFEKGASLGL